MANDCWSIGRKFRTSNVIDDFNREALAVRVARSFPTVKVIEILDEVALWRGYPKMIRTDNGPEYISKEFAIWAKKRGIELHHIQPGKPAQNVEKFNRIYREEVLDMYLIALRKWN